MCMGMGASVKEPMDRAWCGVVVNGTATCAGLTYPMRGSVVMSLAAPCTEWSGQSLCRVPSRLLRATRLPMGRSGPFLPILRFMSTKPPQIRMPRAGWGGGKPAAAKVSAAEAAEIKARNQVAEEEMRLAVEAKIKEDEYTKQYSDLPHKRPMRYHIFVLGGCALGSLWFGAIYGMTSEVGSPGLIEYFDDQMALLYEDEEMDKLEKALKVWP